MKRTILVLALVGLCALVACSDSGIRKAGRVTAAATQGAIDEFNAEAATGEIPVSDAQTINTILVEVRDASRKIADDPRDLSHLSTAEKRQLVVDYISYVNTRAERLQSEGLLRIKSDMGRRTFAKVTKEIARGVSIARVVEAALPSGEQTTTPAATP